MTPVEESVEVEVVDGNPVAFRWREQVYEISDVLHTWSTEEGDWWRFSRREKRQHYRVQAGWNRHRITAELYASARGNGVRWVLSAIYE